MMKMTTTKNNDKRVAMIARYNDLRDTLNDDTFATIDATSRVSTNKIATLIDDMERRIASSKMNTFIPADIARELNVNAKSLRARVRRMIKNDPTFPRAIRGTIYSIDDKQRFIDALRNKNNA
jgi:hypothetical protein